VASNKVTEGHGFRQESRYPGPIFGGTEETIWDKMSVFIPGSLFCILQALT
jgi:hypothetical protein